ncbi:MAG: hypothetical protein AB7S78_06365 [Candidatus Omnitrophota bacterium]
MKANFKAVAFQRKARKKLSEEYLSNPKEFRTRLKKVKKVKLSLNAKD